MTARMPLPARMIGHALRMIAGGSGNHALGSLFGGEGEQFVQRAPLFESSGALLIVELKEHRHS